MKRYKSQTGKAFVQERADGSGWIGGEGCMQGVNLVLYRLPEWKDSKMVCIVEGEKDADSLWALGISATCNPGGAGKWRPEFNPLFAGREVAIFPDNDEPGQRHARDVAHNLLPVANLVRIVILPGLPEKGDVSDWIQGGGTHDELIQLIQQAPPLAYEETPNILLAGSKEPATPEMAETNLRKMQTLIDEGRYMEKKKVCNESREVGRSDISHSSTYNGLNSRDGGSGHYNRAEDPET